MVIGLQSTGEARTLEQLERDDGELTDFVSTAKGISNILKSYCYYCVRYCVVGVFQTLVEKHFPAPDRNRIQRLLGIDTSKKATNGNDEGNSSTGKRKPSKSLLVMRYSNQNKPWQKTRLQFLLQTNMIYALFCNLIYFELAYLKPLF